MSTLKVLIVDDSALFRKQIREALESAPGLVVVATAPNGKLALARIDSMPVDLMVLDLEMPEMNGIETLKELKARKSSMPVIVFSSQSRNGADATLDALALGARDFVAKPGAPAGEDESPVERIRAQLLHKVGQFMPRGSALTTAKASGASPFKNELTDEAKSGLTNLSAPLPSKAPPLREGIVPRTSWERFKPQAIVIASSTGGPQALETIFELLKTEFACPILIAQHMPPVFTASLADRLGKRSGLVVAEGKQGEPLVGGRVYVAPGDFHMRVAHSSERGFHITLDQGAQRNSVRPAADHLFESAAALFGASCLGIVLTGMGDDGACGAVALKNAGSPVVIQNAETCVVFGMPGAVHRLNAYDLVATPQEIASLMRRCAEKAGI